MGILTKIFGDANEKYLKNIAIIVEKINELEPKFERFSDEQLKQQTELLKKRLAKGETLDDILTQAFALVRESAKRTLNQRHFDVQLITGIALHQGKITQMLTGEGKTLASTLVAYLNALSGKGVHIVTVNDYLTRRDAVWMGQIYDLLGLSIGCIVPDHSYIYDSKYVLESPESKTLEEKDQIRDALGAFKVVHEFLRPCTKKQAYEADITYGTNNEFGFDYLRDNMARSAADLAQKDLNFAILDEIDFILVDEARTPLIISAPDAKASELYKQFAKIVPLLKQEIDYEIEEERRIVTLTEQGITKIEKILGVENIYDQVGVDYLHHLEQSLRAQAVNPSDNRPLFAKDRDYVVKDGQIIIVDEFTGRLMPGRRWSGGLHQAIEAKEKVEVLPESRTLSTITFQNYFRFYKKLAGMTGTAITSVEEFDTVYGLDVICIPTNKPMIRKDFADKVYRTEKGKFQALIQEVKEKNTKGQPVLLGTRSIEKNEYLAKLLEREGITCQVLNAKHHEQEGQIIAQAGKLGAVTVATNMAGRGVDIILGGNPQDIEQATEIKVSGGLHIIGTERHEARRIDDQLRGRSGRQGDPGSSQFFLCLEDELLRVFGGEGIERVKSLMEKAKFPEEQPIESGILSKGIERAQAKIEGLHFDARRNLLDYDDVMSKHRQVFYTKRKQMLKASPEKLEQILTEIWERAGLDNKDFLEKESAIGKENFLKIARLFALQILDSHWMRHLEDMRWLRESVRLKAFGQSNPLIAYKTEGYKIFQEMMGEIEELLCKTILKLNLEQSSPTTLRMPGASTVPSISNVVAAPKKISEKIGRNYPCPCGSGKKYKKCCWPKYE